MNGSLRSFALVCVALSSSALGQEFSPPLPRPAPGPMVPGGTPSVGPQGDIHVVLLKSFSCGGASAWAELNTEWPSYGSIPISIDHTSLSCTEFTYEDLVASGADVLAVS